jgi:endoplasmic reticulum chaperone BiP
MVKEAEEFASEDDAQRKRIEALNSLSSFVFGLKTQLADKDGLGGKISEDDKKTIQTALKEATDYVDSHGADASAEDLEEKLAEVQAVVNPITAKLYQSGAPPPGGASGAGGDEEHVHDEL